MKHTSSSRRLTSLAKERTLLAYVRTALALLIAGVSLIQFLGIYAFQILGWTLMIFAALLFIGGLSKYQTLHRS